jgi:Tol biopolymer transport system component
VRRLTNDASDDIEPSWSHNGHWIYYGSTNRIGNRQIYRLPVGGGSPIRVTNNGGVHAEESKDGRWLYYSKTTDSPTSIWRVPAAGGQEIQVLDGLSYSTNFAVGKSGIYFVSGRPQLNVIRIEFYDFATHTRKIISSVDKLYSWGIALSPDERYLLYSVVDRASSNLIFVSSFR